MEAVAFQSNGMTETARGEVRTTQLELGDWKHSARVSRPRDRPRRAAPRGEILRDYVDYYHSCRTHLSLEKDAPKPRPVESQVTGPVTAFPKIGGLHHYYTRLAA